MMEIGIIDEGPGVAEGPGAGAATEGPGDGAATEGPGDGAW